MCNVASDGCREVGRRRAAALQQAAPLAAAAAGSSGSNNASTDAGSENSRQQAADVQQLRHVIRKYIRKRGPVASTMGSSPGGRRGAPPASSTLRRSPASSAQALPAPRTSRTGRKADADYGVPLHLDDGMRPLMPLPLSPQARQARQEQSVAVNKQVCRMFDDLDRKLTAGGCCGTIAGTEKADAGGPHLPAGQPKRPQAAPLPYLPPAWRPLLHLHPAAAAA